MGAIIGGAYAATRDIEELERKVRLQLDSEEFKNLLKSAGLEISRLEPIPDLTSSWFEKSRLGLSRVISKMKSSRSTSSKLAAFEALAVEVDNALLNIREERMIPFFGEAVLVHAGG